MSSRAEKWKYHFCLTFWKYHRPTCNQTHNPRVFSFSSLYSFAPSLCTFCTCSTPCFLFLMYFWGIVMTYTSIYEACGCFCCFDVDEVISRINVMLTRFSFEQGMKQTGGFSLLLWGQYISEQIPQPLPEWSLHKVSWVKQTTPPHPHPTATRTSSSTSGLLIPSPCGTSHALFSSHQHCNIIDKCFILSFVYSI